jgi:hypothetical protein
MRELREIAELCGYEVVVSPIANCVEITGNGHWFSFAAGCFAWLEEQQNKRFDHVNIILRNEDGTRKLIDMGDRGERRHLLPSVGQKMPSKISKTTFRGVMESHHRFKAQATDHGHHYYLGTFDTAEEAALARDKYVLSHNLDVPLNFPELRETKKVVRKQQTSFLNSMTT